MTSPTLTFDPDVMALYIAFSDHAVHETVELSRGVYLDVDEDGQAVGLEILNADKDLVSRIPSLPETAALKDLLKPNAA